MTPDLFRAGIAELESHIGDAILERDDEDTDETARLIFEALAR